MIVRVTNATAYIIHSQMVTLPRVISLNKIIRKEKSSFLGVRSIRIMCVGILRRPSDHYKTYDVILLLRYLQ